MGAGCRPPPGSPLFLRTHTPRHVLREPQSSRRFCDRVTAKWCDIRGGRRSSSRGGRALPGPSAAPGRGSAPRPGGDRTAPRPSDRRDPHERRGERRRPFPRPPACLSTERSPRPRCALSPGPGPASLAPLPAGGGGSSSVQVRTSNPSAMASNAAEREILFTELQVSSGVPLGAAPTQPHSAPLPLPSLAGRMEPPPLPAAPPRPAAPCPPLGAGRPPHPTPRPGRGGGGSPCPPQASSRRSPPGTEAPPPGHGPTPLPAATRFCLLSAPSFPAPSGRVPPSGPAPGRAPRPGRGPAGWGAPSASSEAARSRRRGGAAAVAGSVRRPPAAAPGTALVRAPAGEAPGSHPTACRGVRRRAFPLYVAPRRSRSSFLYVGLEHGGCGEEKMVRPKLFVTRQGFLSL